MRRENERGVALIVVLIMLAVLSVVAASLVQVSQTETWSSQNYRLMSQARYGAESGVHSAANYLINTYAAPGTAADPLANYDTTVSPVRYNGQPVVLSAHAVAESNYPVQAIKDAYFAAARGTLTPGTNAVGYYATATLLSMRQVVPYGSTTPVTMQTWELAGVGDIAGGRAARVDVSSVLERQASPVFAYAAFATYSGCDALSWSGGGTTDSYDSSQVSGGAATIILSGGNVGTNGNLTEAGAPTVIHGNLSTPRTGVGNCTTSTVTAWTLNGNAQVTGGLVELPQEIVYPAPALPAVLPPTSSFSIGAHTAVILPPTSYGNIGIGSGATVHLVAGTYNINSLSLNGNATIVIDSGPVILNVAGQPNLATPLDLTGSTLVNASLDPSNLQIQYAGTGEIKLAGGSSAAAVVYAPRASAKLVGGGDWYGAIIAKHVDDSGGSAIHYDLRLASEFWSIGNYMLNSFTWKKF